MYYVHWYLKGCKSLFILVSVLRESDYILMVMLLNKMKSFEDNCEFYSKRWKGTLKHNYI